MSGCGLLKAGKEKFKMRTLIVEDDFVSRRLLQSMLEAYGQVDIAVNGVEALVAYKLSIDEKTPYDLICIDILMPENERPGAFEGNKELRGAAWNLRLCRDKNHNDNLDRGFR